MTPLSWNEFVSHFEEWSESTRESYVSRLSDFGNHKDVAWYTASIYNKVAASKLINMALDAGVRFDDEDIYLIEFSINDSTMMRVKESRDNYGLNRKNKKEKKNAFWTGVAETEFFDTFIDDVFKKKK